MLLPANFSRVNRFIHFNRSGKTLMTLLWLAFWGLPLRADQLKTDDAPMPFATNLTSLRKVISPQAGRICAYDLSGTVLRQERAHHLIFFQDATEATVLEVDLSGQQFSPGQMIRLRGTNYVAVSPTGLGLGLEPVVDADNLHSAIERSAAIRLRAGLHPIKVLWFNKDSKYSLKVACSGPGIPTQAIPAANLFHQEKADPDRLRPGLRYRCFQGLWEKLPDFNALVPQRTGTVPGFDVSVRTRDENVGLEFSGLWQVPASGGYVFHLESDDGSRLYLDDEPPKVDLITETAPPEAQPMAIAQPLGAAQEGVWSQVEGRISYLSRHEDHVEFELSAGGNRMQVKVLAPVREIPWYLLHGQVRVTGICPAVNNAIGQICAGALLVANWHDVQVLEVAADQWRAYPSATLRDLRSAGAANAGGIVCLHGRLQVDPRSQGMFLDDGTAAAPLDLLSPVPAQTNATLGCLSCWAREGTNIVLHAAVVAGANRPSTGKHNQLPVLTTALQVQQLTRAAASNEYSVVIDGVVTAVSPDFKSLLIQDSTRAVFVWIGEKFSGVLPRMGDYCKIEGISRPADFSPVVVLHRATVLGHGQFPVPVIPKHDQLCNGSLDAQYVEIRGMVIAVNARYVTLLTPEGTFNFSIDLPPGESWNAFINSIVRVRGCLQASWDPETHSVTPDQPIRLLSAAVSIDSPPPADLFKADLVRVKDLLQFDARFDPLRRVRICGQIIHAGIGQDYLMEDGVGLRVRLAQAADLKPGDEVETVGLVELDGSSVVLHQASARVTGRRKLPRPRELNLESLNRSFDATRVSLEGILVNAESRNGKPVLEMQVGVKRFVARVDSAPGSVTPWRVGSRLQLTGVFCVLDGNASPGHDVNSFELRLNSPADVTVLALPPWWTLRRLLVLAVILLAGLVLAFFWITSLRRQVEHRTDQLKREISAREQTERIRAVQEERARIARDLHDDLGSDLTEISMMATAGPGLRLDSGAATERLREIADKSRSMISALDGVVWVVSSKNDTLSSLIEYLASNAEEFLNQAQIACRIELPREYDERIIEAEIRHNVMLAVREAVNNAVRHGRPKAVRLRMALSESRLEILIQDDGCGFSHEQFKGNGVANLRERMEKLGGSCRIESSRDQGTSVWLELPLPPSA